MSEKPEKKGCLQQSAYLVIVIIGGAIILVVALPILYFVILSFMEAARNMP